MMLPIHLKESLVERLCDRTKALQLDHDLECDNRQMISAVFADPNNRVHVSFTNCCKCSMKFIIVIRRDKTK
jgi:hypothetical protein